MRNERPMSTPNISTPRLRCSLFVGTESRSLTLKTTVSKKMNRRNRNQEKNKRSRSHKAGKQKSRKNSALPTTQRTHLRNESEYSPKRFWGEYSDKGVSGQYLRPNIHAIYHEETIHKRVLARHHELKGLSSLCRTYVISSSSLRAVGQYFVVYTPITGDICPSESVYLDIPAFFVHFYANRTYCQPSSTLEVHLWHRSSSIRNKRLCFGLSSGVSGWLACWQC